ncbi:hypothetical protein QTI04_12670 [Variovorax sp. J22R115]|nr:hypothetical protein [Variovorax sp. J22R115]
MEQLESRICFIAHDGGASGINHRGASRSSHFHQRPIDRHDITLDRLHGRYSIRFDERHSRFAHFP